MSEVLYPDGHMTEIQAGLTLEDMAEDRFLFQPLTWARYKDSGRLKLMQAGTPPAAPSHAEAERVARLAPNTP